MRAAFPSMAYMAMGDIFRAITAKPNAIQEYVHRTINVGHLVSDEVTISLFHAYAHTIADGQSMLLDGYPRSMPQLQDFIAFMEKQERPVMGIMFDISRETAVQRAMSRGRDDDTREAIERRLDAFMAETQPVIDRFGEVFDLSVIDAERNIEDIAADVKLLVETRGKM